MSANRTLPGTVVIAGRTHNLDWTANDNMDGWVAVVVGAAPANLGTQIDDTTGYSPREEWMADNRVDGVDYMRVFADGDVALHIRA